MNEFMHHAIQSARGGIGDNHGGPFGACIVENGKVLAVAHNTVIRDQDPTCHAEMNAIRMAAKEKGMFDLSSCEIYSTAEPCPMCLAAIYWARIPKLYIGVPKSVAAEYGFDDAEFYRQLDLPLEKRALKYHSGIMREDCAQVFSEWKKLGRQLY
jgi:guanine deaminase